jgi:sensor histidine kinase YesM
MYLQKMRFGSRVEYEVNCEVDEEKTVVPTFTFQPIIENAMIHGISPKVEGGKISVHVYSKENRLFITISDTGTGIDEERLKAIRKQLDDREDTLVDEDIVGIGLGNINRRIKAMYPDGSIYLDSKAGEGTTIAINIPLQEADKRN